MQTVKDQEVPFTDKNLPRPCAGQCLYDKRPDLRARCVAVSWQYVGVLQKRHLPRRVLLLCAACCAVQTCT